MSHPDALRDLVGAQPAHGNPFRYCPSCTWIEAPPAYTGHPSCTTCHVDYLGRGTCGRCLYVANLLALLGEVREWVSNGMPNELVGRIDDLAPPSAP